jgi:site-specific DNA recombinase
MKKCRAALLVRVSSEEQLEGWFLDAQEHTLREEGERRGWDIVRVYRDEGHSAWKSPEKRVGLQALMLEAPLGVFNVVVVHKHDRFMRNRYDSAIYKQQLSRLGIGVVAVARTD